MRYITTWRKTDNVLEWDHFISENINEVSTVIDNLKKRGVIQFHTYPIGDIVEEFSSKF